MHEEKTEHLQFLKAVCFGGKGKIGAELVKKDNA